MKQRVGALVGPVAQKMWVSHVPLGLRAHPAPRRRPARLPVVLHDLRPGRRGAAHRLRHPRPQPRPEAVPAPVGARHHQRGQERRHRRRGRTPSGPQVIFERKIADVYREYQARLLKAGAMDFDDLLAHHRRAVPAPPRRARALPQPLPARPGRRVPGHQPRPERARPAPRRRAPQRLRRGRHATSAFRPGTLVADARRDVPIEHVAVGDEVVGTGGRRRGPRRPTSRHVKPGRYDGPARTRCTAGGRTLRGHAAPPRPGRLRARRPATMLVYLM